MQGMRSIKLKMFDGREMLLQEVRYVLEIESNLSSINMFEQIWFKNQ